MVLEKRMIGWSKIKQGGDWLIKEQAGTWLADQTSRSRREHPGSESTQRNWNHNHRKRWRCCRLIGWQGAVLAVDWLTWWGQGFLRGLTSDGGGPQGGRGLGQTLVEDRVCVIGQVDRRHRAPAWGTERASHTRGHTRSLPVVSRLNPSPRCIHTPSWCTHTHTHTP